MINEQIIGFLCYCLLFYYFTFYGFLLMIAGMRRLCLHPIGPGIGVLFHINYRLGFIGILIYFKLNSFLLELFIHFNYFIINLQANFIKVTDPLT